MIRPPSIRSPDMDKVKREIAIDRDLAEAAERLGLDLGVEAERTLRRRLASLDARAEHVARSWREENADAIAFNNEELENRGLWSDGYRLF